VLYSVPFLRNVSPGTASAHSLPEIRALIELCTSKRQIPVRFGHSLHEYMNWYTLLILPSFITFYSIRYPEIEPQDLTMDHWPAAPCPSRRALFLCHASLNASLMVSSPALKLAADTSISI
jgi:hypothetical protein